jgi:hypothetical protein
MCCPDERQSTRWYPAATTRNTYTKATDLADMLSPAGRPSSMEVSIYTYPGDPLGSDPEHRPQTFTAITPKPTDERPAGRDSPVPDAPTLDRSSRLHGAGPTADRATLTFVRDHAASGRPAAPMPTTTTLRITGQVRPGQDAPTEITLDHQVTVMPITIAPADGVERACNLQVDDTAIGWVAYGRARGSYGWVWGDQLASHRSFRFVAASRSAAVFCELLAAVRAGTVADARTTTPA